MQKEGRQRCPRGRVAATSHESKTGEGVNASEAQTRTARPEHGEPVFLGPGEAALSEAKGSALQICDFQHEGHHADEARGQTHIRNGQLGQGHGGHLTRGRGTELRQNKDL